MLDHAYLIALMPLISAAIILFFGRWLPMEGAFVGILAILVSLVHSVLIFVGIHSGGVVLPLDGPLGKFFETSLSPDWISLGGTVRLELGVLIDGMSSVMLVVVTLVSFLVQIYSLGYQHGKPRFGRYYAYLSLFTFSMLVLVIANNYLQFFMGWELVGLCSYLLIGFEFERNAAAYASRKAFITTRVGDLGFYIGLLLLFSSVGTMNFNIINMEHAQGGHLPGNIAGLIGVLFFCGAMGKSAQVPLHVWLPDAMEGPTPVSALIHAATMVAAGVYLMARSQFLLAMSPTASDIVAWVGCGTAFIAATNALVANDIKKVLAYSTISQLGYMIMAIGVGNVQAGMFHLTTHAFFKALLFLGAGSVIHAVHTNDIWKMGGLSRKMPITFITFACATLAIIGMPGLSGFFSKEAILASAYHGHHTAIFVLASLTALMTAFYMCRLFFLTFMGEPRDSHLFAHAHESEPVMTGPLIVLGVLSVIAGLFFTFVWPFSTWIPAAEGAGHHEGHLVMYVSLSALIVGAGLAFLMYRKNTPSPASVAGKFSGLYDYLGRRVADEVYLSLIRAFVDIPARAMAWIDYNVLDQGIVDGFGRVSRLIARFDRWFDDKIVDGIFVNGFGVVSQGFGMALRLFQTGFAQFYLLVVAFGVSLLMLWALRVFG